MAKGTRSPLAGGARHSKRGAASKKFPLCSPRRFLLLFGAQAVLVILYLTPPHMGPLRSRAATSSSDASKGGSTQSNSSEESHSLQASTAGRSVWSWGFDILTGRGGLPEWRVADVAVQDPEMQLFRQLRRGQQRQGRGKKPTKQLTSAERAGAQDEAPGVAGKGMGQGAGASAGVSTGVSTESMTSAEAGASLGTGTSHAEAVHSQQDQGLTQQGQPSPGGEHAQQLSHEDTSAGDAAVAAQQQQQQQRQQQQQQQQRQQQRQRKREQRLRRMRESKARLSMWASTHSWPPDSEASRRLRALNALPPRNRGRFPVLAPDRVVVVLFVHRRPQFLRRALQGLAVVEGLNRTLLIVSHDGQYPEVDALVRQISFCQVKQIYSPYSPEFFPGVFPGAMSSDCKGDASPYSAPDSCTGQADHYGHFRNASLAAVKHHWWWMMNTVWDGLLETRSFRGHVMVLEEDVLLLPGAYRHAQALVRAKQQRCPECIAVQLAPAQQNFFGDASRQFVRDKLGNIGYTFNRTIWERIREQHEDFCAYDDYNWDATLASAVLADWPSAEALRWSRASAIHFGSCGMHMSEGRLGASNKADCEAPDLSWLDSYASNEKYLETIDPEIHFSMIRWQFNRTDGLFDGWGGWGDFRDHALCELFVQGT